MRNSTVLTVCFFTVVALSLLHHASAQAPSQPSTTALAAPSASSGAPPSPASAIPTALPALSPATVPSSGASAADLTSNLVALTSALTKFVEKRSEPENLTTTVFDVLAKVAALLVTLIAGYGAYKATQTLPWFKEHKEFIATCVVSAAVVVLFYLLSGIVVSTLYILIAVLVLLTAMLIAAAHLLAFIDTKYPDVRDSILASFSESSADKDLQKLARDNIRNMHSWLSSLSFIQNLSGDIELHLPGSFATDFDSTTFRLEPSERITSGWQLIDDRMLIPISASIVIRNSEDMLEGLVVNIQPGLVVISVEGKIQYKKFDQPGLQLLASALNQYLMAKLSSNMESQKELANSIELFRSQSI